MLLDEYVLLAVESQLQNERDADLQTLLDKYTKSGEGEKNPKQQKPEQSHKILR